MVKKYIVELTEEEQAQLQALIKKGKRAARTITRAHTLLNANLGKPDILIAESLQVGVSTVERTRRTFVEGGIDFALNDQLIPGGQRKLDGKQEAFLIATACSDPPQGRTEWTIQLLADRLVTLGVVDSISNETVRRVLKKTMSNRG